MRIPDFTTEQLRHLANAPRFSSALSIMGSGWIIWEVLRNDQKQSMINYRLLLGMSIYDIFQSLAYFMSSWAVPVGTERAYGAAGTTGTCTAQGFFMQMGVATLSYNMFIALYYFLYVRFDLTKRSLERIEVAMHVLSFLIPFISCVLVLEDQAFNFAFGMCW
eukprot:CAMPEP_0195510654 /NCGR_PEP_ID=MMETSP0794_2-20130614/3236_1 /TAXON_ID=515487 /ORGANISM="Stephanopyxis turris, Strain CCMP 815" /LENGTH=162 /DNA_ID=CAMNT_0040638121 /DNA_START=170 /DNA_END=655 /DNA_ORIENTATION=+